MCFVVANSGPLGRIWLARSEVIEGWHTPTQIAERAARFLSAADADKARKEHEGRVGILQYKIAVRVPR
jgi:hypothetical protein